MKSKKITAAFFSAYLLCASQPAAVQAQSELYPRLFDLEEVRLTEGIFKQAMELNDATLMAYDVDRLLTPFMRQAGFTEWEKEHPNFTNWASDGFRLDGHVGGHYLSALALAYAASTDETMKAQLKERMNYMVDQLEKCQQTFDGNTDGLRGYIGGLPDNDMWTGIYHGDPTRYYQGNVPFYVIHKIYAGLRDAYVYGDNEKAKTCFLKLCDWGIDLISNIDDATMQNILNVEHGGMCEMYADAYTLTGDEKYLTAAKRYSHQSMINGMQTLSTTFLDNMHANTQVPKYVGFARIAQEFETIDAATATTYRKAAHNFWNDVTENRTVALGGNSISEHFLPASQGSKYVNNPDGPESCNTNNMLKLTEDLFADDPNAKYADFYETAMLNHILSTQNPHTGGYVYFTSLRPQHYRIYSQVNQGMWCCVGTGMENHSKYGEFIYAHSPENDTLYVNLFVASQLESEHFGLTQQTAYPYEEQTTLTIDKAGDYVLALRHPEWCKGDYQVSVNGTTAETGSTPGSYACISRSWSEGDKITVSLPMEMEMMPCPNYDDYVAFRYGPVLLGAKTGTEDLVGQFAGEGRMDHSPGIGPQLNLNSAPMLIDERENVLDSIEIVDKSRLQFKFKSGIYNDKKFADLILEPFFTIHECRYMLYWYQTTQKELDAIEKAEADAAQRLQERTIDFVATGEQQSDAGHLLQGTYGKGTYADEHYVDAFAGNWFSYVLSTKGISKDVSLMCRYYSGDANRVCTIYINGEVLKEIKLESKDFTGFYEEEYLIPEEMLQDKDGNTLEEITVKFAATGTTPTPGLYYLRLLKEYDKYPKPYRFVCTQWVSGDNARVSSIEYDREANTIKVNGNPGNNNIALQFDPELKDSAYVTGKQKYLLARGTSLTRGADCSYLWWLNGACHGTSVSPTYEIRNAEGVTTVIWDITQSGLTEFMQGDSIMLSDNNNGCTTIFGLTSSAADHSAVISDVGFYSQTEILHKYPELAANFRTNIFDEEAETFQVNPGFSTAYIEKTFKAGEWTPVCFPATMAMTTLKDYFSEVKSYAGNILSGNGDLTLYFEKASTIQNGKLCIAKSLTDLECLDFEAISAYATADPAPVTDNGVTLQGIFCKKDVDSRTYTFKDGGFVANTDGEPAKGLSFYVQLSAEDMAKVHRVLISFDDMPTGIRSSFSDDNGQTEIYRLDGIKLQDMDDAKNSPRKGAYIINGKKIIM